MTNRPKAIGTATETAVVRYLRDNGYPHAERRALHGNNDLGDITGIVGVVVEVKGGKAAETSAPADLTTWQAQTLTETENAGAQLGLLICKRKGVGATRVDQWWAWLYLPHLADTWGLNPTTTPPVWFRTNVRDALVLLRHSGYGNPLEGAA